MSFNIRDDKYYFQAQSRKYRGMFEVNNPEECTTSSGK